MRRARAPRLTSAWWDDAVDMLVEVQKDATRPRLTLDEAEARLIAARSDDRTQWPRCVRCETRTQNVAAAIGLPCPDCRAVESERLQRMFRPYRRALPDQPRAA